VKNLDFTGNSWIDYLYWQGQDKKTVRQIHKLIQDIDRNGNKGIGKPEPLREDMAGYWSRRIDEKNRMIYRVSGEVIELYALRTHYGDK
jgi:toxin YoeB